jgi:hypothetical protein
MKLEASEDAPALLPLRGRHQQKDSEAHMHPARLTLLDTGRLQGAAPPA